MLELDLNKFSQKRLVTKKKNYSAPSEMSFKLLTWSVFIYNDHIINAVFSQTANGG